MPAESTIQTQMDLFMGKAPNVDSNGVIDNISFKLNVVAKTADYTVTAQETGTFFTTEGATGGVNFTLPTNADGLVYWFFCAEDFELMVTAGTADTLITHNDVAADSVAFTTATEQVGSGFMVVADGSKWMVVTLASNDGTNAAQLTVAT